MKIIICNNELSGVLVALMGARRRLKERKEDIPGLTLLKVMKIAETLYNLQQQFEAVFSECKQQYVEVDENGAYKVSNAEDGLTQFQCKTDQAAGELLKVMTAPNEVDLQYLLDDGDLRHLPLTVDELSSIELFTTSGAIYPGTNNKEE